MTPYHFFSNQSVLYPPQISHDVSFWTESPDIPNIVPILLDCVGLAFQEVRLIRIKHLGFSRVGSYPHFTIKFNVFLHNLMPCLFYNF